MVELPPVHLKNAIDGSRSHLATAVRVGYRDGRLLVRFDGRDEGVMATHTRRDAPLWQEDVFEVFLTPHDPPVVYYEFEVNPLGTLFDARIESPDLRRETMRINPAWTCTGLSARVRRTAGSWSALLRIPLSPLEGGNGRVSLHWLANFYRIDRGQADAYSAWSPTFADPPDFHRPERFGRLLLPPRA